MNAGSASASWTTLENVRAHLRIVSRTGHSQALSMWACPTATTLCALAEAGWARASASSARAAAAVPAMSSGSAASIARCSATRISARRLEETGSSFIGPASVQMSALSSQTAMSRRSSASFLITYNSVPASVAGSPFGVGWNPVMATSGLAAASR